MLLDMKDCVAYKYRLLTLEFSVLLAGNDSEKMSNSHFIAPNKLNIALNSMRLCVIH